MSEVAIHTQASSMATYQNQRYFQKCFPKAHTGSPILGSLLFKNKIEQGENMTMQGPTFTKTNTLQELCSNPLIFQICKLNNQKQRA